MQEVNSIHHTLNRKVVDKRSGTRVTRIEGQPPVGGDGLLDKLYNMIGDFYNYLLLHFNRNSFDGKGGLITAYLSPPCSDSSQTGNTIDICADTITYDNVGHELGHVIVYNTANFDTGPGTESIGLDEGYADMFGTMLDYKWVVYDNDTNTSLLRDFANPANSGHPDKLFSPLWKCKDGYNNSVVLTHTLYLMTVGGSQNGCTITAMGKDNANLIIYQALIKYLKSTSNFLDFYKGITNACNELFGQGSAICTSVQAASLATELNQQPAGKYKGPRCYSGTKEKKPICPAPLPIVTPTATPTLIPTHPPFTPTP